MMSELLDKTLRHSGSLVTNVMPVRVYWPPEQFRSLHKKQTAPAMSMETDAGVDPENILERLLCGTHTASLISLQRLTFLDTIFLGVALKNGTAQQSLQFGLYAATLFNTCKERHCSVVAQSRNISYACSKAHLSRRGAHRFLWLDLLGQLEELAEIVLEAPQRTSKEVTRALKSWTQHCTPQADRA
eukprot:CAMPEP_0179164532 /NCGR_PEP_ID=MMETSP0796-20121207/80754_1 /TAXON_ID=73915 /ORGANISM="Pyrodinium bahamense, Strain pbaha01" /LENGTH=186 /DNA_ID=CAMNT_0020866997 /DNA_START=14 /DNA_END=570 /DNA_ORIENTATION=-